MFIVNRGLRLKKPQRGGMCRFHVAPNGADMFHQSLTIDIPPLWG